MGAPFSGLPEQVEGTGNHGRDYDGSQMVTAVFMVGWYSRQTQSIKQTISVSSPQFVQLFFRDQYKNSILRAAFDFSGHNGIGEFHSRAQLTEHAAILMDDL